MKNQSHAPAQLWLKKGDTVTHDDREYVITAIADLNLVLAKEVGAGHRVMLNMSELGPPKRCNALLKN